MRDITKETAKGSRYNAGDVKFRDGSRAEVPESNRLRLKPGTQRSISKGKNKKE